MTQALRNAPDQELTAVVVNYQPGGKSEVHRHAGSVFAYVLSGAIRSQNSATGPARVYRAGEAFFEPESTEHMVSENASTTEPASMLAVIVADHGAALTTPAAASYRHNLAKSTPAEFVDALNLVFGSHPHARAVHAKGIVLTGKFTPSATAASLSTAPHFQGGAVSVVARFSNFAGIPTVADTDPLADPRGLALRFHLPDGSDTDLVTHSFNGFPAATSDEFRQFLTALGSSPPGTPSPTPASTYLAAHPVAQHFLAAQQGPPTSYATLAYFGVNAFAFRNGKGEVRFGRYRIVPVGGVHLLSAAQIAEAAPDYLAAELRTRVARAPIQFRLCVQLAGEHDRIDDPTIAWPESRPVLDLGLLEITATANGTDADRELLFLPTKLPAGIEPADPMLVDRGNAYPESFRRRQQ